MLTDNETPKKETNPLRTTANKIGSSSDKVNDSAYIEINKQSTHIPINLPSAIIGDKGSGKTTLLMSIMEETYKNKIFQHVYFIFSQLTWDLELPHYIKKINISEAEQFLGMYFETKSIFNSYVKFFKSLDMSELMEKYKQNKLTEADILEHVDNNIIKYNQAIFNSNISSEQKIDKIITIGEKIIKKFSKQFYINNVSVDGLKDGDRDLIIIDDIATASKMLFKNKTDDYLYEYFTLTRHMRLCIILAGQQVEQLPKKLRREIMCWILSKTTDLSLLDGVIQRSTLEKIKEEQKKLDKYEFVAYNKMDGEINII